MKKVFKITGIKCASCVRNIEDLIKREIKDAKNVNINFASSKLYLETSLTDKQIQRVVSLAGNYKLNNERKNTDKEQLKSAATKMWIAVFFSAIIMVLMVLMMTGLYVFPNYFFITLFLSFPVIFIAGWDTHKSALISVIKLKPNMDTLVTMGSLVPFCLSFLRFLYPSMTTFIEMASTILALHLVGRFLETKAKGKASLAIKKLLEIGAKKAVIIVNGTEKEIDVEDLRIGDVMIVKPGEKIPTDGIVVEGESYVDESIATGESVPVKKIKNRKVIGSTVNGQGFLTVKVERVGKETFLSQVISLVEECQGSKIPIQEFADRITGYFVPFVLLLAISSFFSWMIFPDFHIRIIDFFNFPWINIDLPLLTLAILSMTAVLVISCPCALGLATPTALMVGSGLGAERGILIRRGEAIQTMKDVKVILFDKTGTITKGRPEVTDIVCKGKYEEDVFLKFAASIESFSEHPLGSAIVREAKKRNIKLEKPKEFQAITGKGVSGEVGKRRVFVGSLKSEKENFIGHVEYRKERECLEKEGKTVIFVVIDEEVVGILAVTDEIKENAKEIIEDIKSMGIKTAMLTGDNKRTASVVAKKVGLDFFVSEVLPVDKVEEVKKMQEKHGVVAMVGDGINDAPALKQANVGVAIGTGADIAIEAADITLIGGDLKGVTSAIKLSNYTFKKIKENYFWAWFYNGVAIPVAFFGLLHPIIGALAMALSSINVILNSLRLKKVKL